MLIAYIAKDDNYDDCVLQTEYGESSLYSDKDLLDAVNEWMEYNVCVSDYKDGQTIVKINVLDTDTQKITIRELKAVRHPAYELV